MLSVSQNETVEAALDSIVRLTGVARPVDSESTVQLVCDCLFGEVNKQVRSFRESLTPGWNIGLTTQTRGPMDLDKYHTDQYEQIRSTLTGWGSVIRLLFSDPRNRKHVPFEPVLARIQSLLAKSPDNIIDSGLAGLRVPAGACEVITASVRNMAGRNGQSVMWNAGLNSDGFLQLDYWLPDGKFTLPKPGTTARFTREWLDVHPQYEGVLMLARLTQVIPGMKVVSGQKVYGSINFPSVRVMIPRDN